MHPCTTQLPACTRPHGVVSSAGRPRRQLPCHRGRPSPPALLPLATPKRAPVLPMLQTRLCSIKESGLRHTPNNGRQPSQRRQMRLCVTSLPKRTLNNNQRSLPLRHKIHLSHQNRTSIRKEASNAPHNAIPISTYRNFRTIPRHLPCRRKRIGRPGNLPPPHVLAENLLKHIDDIINHQTEVILVPNRYEHTSPHNKRPLRAPWEHRLNRISQRLIFPIKHTKCPRESRLNQKIKRHKYITPPNIREKSRRHYSEQRIGSPERSCQRADALPSYDSGANPPPDCLGASVAAFAPT
ncbi:hypothetical protein MYXA107069_23305 [Myxococcus xanthus]|nr:hypothetical protein MyxoNM_11660 [Myxococcus xanthus]SDY28103.1 hypothetical protein SAMN05444383_1312 [Myxococcus xanthus]